MSNLYHTILLYPVEPCAPSCTSSLEPTCIDWHSLHSLSCLRSLSFHSLWRLAVTGPRTRRSLSFADPPASRPGRSFVSSANSPSIQHAHSHSAFGHIAVSLSWAFRYPFLCLVSSSLLLSHAATYTSLHLQSVHSNHHRSALQKRPPFTAERTSLNLEPPLPYLVVPSAFALWLSFFIPCQGI